MNELNRQLQEVFLFSPADLHENRLGRLSPRQQARQRASRSSIAVSMGAFVVVMCGTIGILVWMNREMFTSDGGNGLITLVVAAVVIGVVVLVGLLTSRRYTAASRAKQIATARGKAQAGKVRPESAHFEIKIGTTRLRLVTEEQLAAFQEGIEYRVFYLPGPVSTILSGEVVGSESEAALAAMEEGAMPVDQDQVVQLNRRARPILYVLVFLVLGIPIVGFATTNLPEILRWAVWVAMLGISIGFVYWSLRRVS